MARCSEAVMFTLCSITTMAPCHHISGCRRLRDKPFPWIVLRRLVLTISSRRVACAPAGTSPALWRGPRQAIRLRLRKENRMPEEQSPTRGDLLPAPPRSLRHISSTTRRGAASSRVLIAVGLRQSVGADERGHVDRPPNSPWRSRIGARVKSDDSPCSLPGRRAEAEDVERYLMTNYGMTPGGVSGEVGPEAGLPDGGAELRP